MSDLVIALNLLERLWARMESAERETAMNLRANYELVHGRLPEVSIEAFINGERA